ncbi:rhodanese-like domain-containing protein [Aliarcobacter butzleri]|uniref:Rhodanese-like domain-containing protein n=1 Tax=Aliarcobacter butzleri TaxID=28197 RepID=A0AAW6VN22_9BACT|nr:rhodanese-like domain-containing protein [Aliarcobacter butzleri]MCT7594313.1 rhodanese-like domain-containing protein [Aliarcobacter butzleri]MCT7598936.1 rhodanese-like domain-containing protein [Aliarcobacter butzleri]MCT7643690.1 rhodanese-like domain-containing protein [Aliarcobacter butzleri]MCT7652740.1 rhodanese-like domain-containing protein [Aliarcobacter butzleri]MDK2062423.1 rhodanese-like domain-containing protein [Aliarcobacter butzleri]
MRKVIKNIVLASFLAISGVWAQDELNLKEPTKAVYDLIKKYNLEQVDYEYVKKSIGLGNRSSASSILIDARPALKYQKGTIPSSYNIPDTNFDEYYKAISDIPKDKELIVFCGGYSCEKSPIVAQKLKEKGHKNVKIYSAGEPEWSTKNYLEVDTIVTKAYQENNSALLVDARPFAKYLQETIIGAISVPDTDFEKLLGRFPINKDEKILIFCSGFNCEKSNIVANKLYALGYKNVVVYAGGLPAWKEAGLKTTSFSKASKDENAQTSIKKDEFSKNGLKLGKDQGSVDGEWLKALILENKVPEYIQIVNILNEQEFKNGHIKGSINIEAGKLSAKELYEKLPKNKTIVFHCTAGSRSLEAWMKLNSNKYDMSEIYYFDANITCKGNNCKIDVNEPLE